MQIFKYPIPLQTEFYIEMPNGSQILSFQSQREKLQLWVLVHTNMETIQRRFNLLGTGQSINPDSILKYIGTT